MNLDEKIKVQTSLIAQLNEENEKLKKEKFDIQLKLSLSNNNYSEMVERANRIMEECQILKETYDEAIKKAKNAKTDVDKIKKELYLMKQKYSLKINEIINEI